MIPPRPQSEGAPRIAIEAEGLTCRFGDFVAVDHVSFRIERGEIFGFLGSNGCGKSTTMKMLTGLLPPAKHVRAVRPAGGRQRHGDPSPGRLHVPGLFLYAELSVRQNLVLHARLFHLPADGIPARVGEMLRRFDLEKVADERPTTCRWAFASVCRWRWR